MTRKMGLGRGLSALISPIPEEPAAGAPLPAGARVPEGQVVHVPVERIAPGAHQARKTFDDAALAELAETIRAHGVVQPLLVRETPDGYELIAGERRWRAARLAGLKEVPAIVRREEGADVYELSLIENLHRADLNPIEEATAYRELIERFAYTQEALAARLARARATVANLLRLLKLPPSVQEAVAAGRLTAGHARALLPLPDDDAILALRDLVLAEGMTVRGVERLVAKVLDERAAAGAERPAPRKVRAPSAEFPYPYVVEKLRERLQTKVGARGGESAGVIEIHYYSVDELTRLVELIVGRE